MHFRLFISSLFILLFAGCAVSKNQPGTNPDEIRLQFLGEYIFPNGQKLNGTVIGGLSGIDYDQKKDQYYLICDDPSANGPARFYTATIGFSEKGIDSVSIKEVTMLLNEEGKPYPDITKDMYHSADAESMRYDPVLDVLVRGSEGQRRNTNGEIIIQQPDIIIMSRDGKWRDSIPLPANMKYYPEEKGLRHNSVFEGLAFSSDYRYLYVNSEEGGYEDGPRAGMYDSTAWLRIMKIDMKTKKQVAQYAYRLDALREKNIPANAFRINGMSDLMWLGDERLLVIERGYYTNIPSNDIRVYIAELKGAENVAANSSFARRPVKKPVVKTLLFDFNSLGIVIDNIEGVCFGPLLPNGHRSLLFVADNNFSTKQKNQFLLFEIIP